MEKMNDPIPLNTNDLTQMLREYEKQARKGPVSYAMVIAQTEDEDGYVAWCQDEAGEMSADPDHIIQLIGMLQVQMTYAVRMLDEVLLVGLDDD